MFEHHQINFDSLYKKAYNLRWANVPEGVIPLTAADPDFPCAPEIAEDLQKYVAERYFSYAPAEGFLFFREAAAQFYESKRKYKVSPELILPIDSAAFGIHLVCKTFLNRGDEAIILDPVDFLFKFSIENQGAVAVPFQLSTDPIATPDFDKLESLITPKTKMICLCNPVNPIGKVFTKDELLAIGKIAVKHQLVIMSDEIWSDIIFDPSSFISIATLDKAIENNTIIINGFSKSYALAGLRIGMLATTNSHFFKQLFEASLHGATIHGANVLGQVAATTALTKCEYWLNDFIRHLHMMRKMGMEKINEIGNISCYAPQGCYLFFCNITQTGYSSQELSDLLLDKGKVFVVPGLPKWFGDGAEGHIRICFSTSAEILSEGLERIKNTIQLIG